MLRLAGRRLVETESLPLGSVNVSERFLPGEKAPAKAMKALRKQVEAELEGLGWWEGGGRLVGIGGTIRNLAAAAMRRAELPLGHVQGFELTRDALEELIELLAGRPASKRGDVSGIKPDRGDVILGGALVLAAALDSGGFDCIEVTEAGLREGVFFERLLGERELFDDVRRESVENLAHRFNSEPEHVGRVAALSLGMFDGLAAAGLHDLGDAERELLWAACVLHDIGTAIDYEDHHRHSHYLILNAGLPGFGPRELVLIGLIARYHRKGQPDASELGSLARARRRRAAAAAVRDHPPRRAARAQPRRRDPARERLRRRTARSRSPPTPTRRSRPPCRSGPPARTRTLLARRARARGRDRVIRRVAASLPLAVVLLDVTAVAVLLPDIRLALGSSASGRPVGAERLPARAGGAAARRSCTVRGRALTLAGAVVCGGAARSCARPPTRPPRWSPARPHRAQAPPPCWPPRSGRRPRSPDAVLPALALAFGPLVGGVFAEQNWWHVLFWAASRSPPSPGWARCRRPRTETTEALSPIRLLALAAGLTALTIGWVQSEVWAWGWWAASTARRARPCSAARCPTCAPRRSPGRRSRAASPRSSSCSPSTSSWPATCRACARGTLLLDGHRSPRWSCGRLRSCSPAASPRCCEARRESRAPPPAWRRSPRSAPTRATPW